MQSAWHNHAYSLRFFVHMQRQDDPVTLLQADVPSHSVHVSARYLP